MLFRSIAGRGSSGDLLSDSAATIEADVVRLGERRVCRIDQALNVKLQRGFIRVQNRLRWKLRAPPSDEVNAPLKNRDRHHLAVGVVVEREGEVIRPGRGGSVSVED